MVRLFRKLTNSYLTVTFADLGVSAMMSDDAIQSHVDSLYFGWYLILVIRTTTEIEKWKHSLAVGLEE